MRFLRPCLERAGFTEEELSRFVEFGQGYLSMGPAIRMLEERLLSKSLKHGNHPVLQMCAANAAVVTDDANNRKFTKKKSTGRIDCLVALAMACAVAAQPQAEEQYVTGRFIAI
jgi:phage terminase large subunit-like protein